MALPCFVSPEGNNVILMVIAIIIGMVATFLATFFLYKDEDAQ